MPSRTTLERLYGAGAVDVDDGAELIGEAGAESVALSLGLRAVHDTDRALEPLVTKGVGEVPVAVGQHREAR